MSVTPGSEIEVAAPVPAPRENVYGSVKRLDWIRSQISAGDRVVDLGCGTGFMITLPLLRDGVDVTGVDLDSGSVALGRRILTAAGEDPDRLREQLLQTVEGTFDVAIVSEVFEHQNEEQLDALLAAVREKLNPGGRLLVTVPNGYGWFELESALFYRLGIGKVLGRLGLLRVAGAIRHRLTRGYVDAPYPSSLDGSPHIQRFTRRSIRRRLEGAGFAVDDVGGTAIFAGPFSQTLFTGVGPFMRANNAVASRFPSAASGFLVSARLPR